MAPKFFLRVQAKLKITDFRAGVVVGLLLSVLLWFAERFVMALIESLVE